MDTTHNAISVTVALSAPARSVATTPECGAWAIAGGELLQVDAAGALTRQVSLKSLNPQLGPTSQVTVNPYDASLWVSDGKLLFHLSAHGAVREGFTLPSSTRQAALALDETLWALGNKGLAQVQSPAGVLGSYALQGSVTAEPKLVALDSLRGAVWLGGEKQLTRVDLQPAPQVAFTVPLAQPVIALAVNPYTGEVWGAGATRLTSLSPEGALTRTIDLAALGLSEPASLAFEPVSRSLKEKGQAFTL